MGSTDLHEASSSEEQLSEQELDALVQSTLDNAGVELSVLRAQAHEGRFASEKLRRAWFIIAGLGRG